MHCAILRNLASVCAEGGSEPGPPGRPPLGMSLLIRVRNAKGGRDRVVPIHPGLVPLFLAYAATRQDSDDPALFLGVLGRRLNSNIMAITFRRYATAAGVNKRKKITPHTLRHVFATELLDVGANLRQIQELLGHKHLDSTQRYTRVNAHQLRGAIKRLPWTQGPQIPNRGASSAGSGALSNFGQ